MSSSSKRRRNRLLLTLLITGVVMVLTFLLSPRLIPVERVTYDMRVRWGAMPSPVSDQISVILIDQASLDWGQKENDWRWPWPREVQGALLQYLNDAGAKAVFFDLLYTEPSPWGVADDEALAAAIANCPRFVAALNLGRADDPEGVRDWPENVPVPKKYRPMRESNVLWGRATFPIDSVATNAACLATVSASADSDSIYRRLSPAEVFVGVTNRVVLVPTPALVMLDDDAVVNYPFSLHNPGAFILKYRDGIRVYKPWSAAAVLQSYMRMMEGETPAIPPSAFKDKYVLVGASAPGLLDLRPTPVDESAPGVFIHATLLDNLLSGEQIRHASAPAVVLLFFLSVLLAAGFMLFSRKTVQLVLAFVLFPLLPPLLGLACYALLNVWWPLVPHLLAILLALTGGLMVRYATEGRQKAFIKQAFRHYLSPQVIEQIMEDPSRLQLGGERRELSIFFSDLQGFSGFSERMEPQELTALLNDYLSEMTAIVLDEGGTLDKYEGDAIIAFWNAPLGQEDHAARALRCALRTQQRLAELRPGYREKYDAEMIMRIGLNSGPVIVGNMGSHERFDYTVLGDAANLAARLEGVNKVFGTPILISEATRQRAGDAFNCREIGRIRVVGRESPVRVFEPLAAGAPRAESFAAGLQQVYDGRWAEAAECFEQLPDDPPSLKYLTRCRELLEDPSTHWDGIWNLTSK